MQQQSHPSVTGTILVVDDQPSNHALLEELLSAEGYTVITALNGLSALQHISKQQIDLVLLDVMMPDLSGFEVCQKIKNGPETNLIPVVLVTSLSEKEDRLEGIEAGADDFLTRPVNRMELLARVRSLLTLKFRTDELERAESVLFTLARSIESKDPYTHGHCERLAGISVRLGQRIGLPEDQILALRRAGIVHDIGKVAVPDAILLKPGRLTPEEWTVMQQHPIVGERICSPLKSFRSVLPIIRHHHEKLDGSGYPDKLRGEAIPVTARVLQIVDVFDALTTDRPYKQAMSVSQALVTMRDEVGKGWWDGRIFGAFEKFVAADLGQTLFQAATAGKEI